MRVCLALVLLSVLAGGCAAQPTGGPRAWIDVPIDGARVPAGIEIQVQSHAYARAGVAEVLLSIDGVPYRRDPPGEPGAALTSLSQAWMPDGPGDYSLQVVAYDGEGGASAPDDVLVTVLGVTPTPESTATPETSPTAVRTLTLVPTVPPTPYVTFSADSPSVVQGECTTLRWRAGNAVSASLDGVSVALEGTEQVCPSATTTYRLHVIALAGPVDQAVTVNVSAPADTTPPTITGLSASTDEIYEPNCEPNTVAISARVSDGARVDSVEVVYRVTGGSWQTRSMSLSGGTYRVTLDWLALEASRDPAPTASGSVLEYYIRARDWSGNSSQSGNRTVEITYCLI
jgi:hypothetical protein